MTRAEVRALIKQGINALGNQIEFGSGRITEFNKEENKDYPFVWLESLSVTTGINAQGANTDEWDCKLHIAKKDQPDSKADEYEQIVDECDYIAQQLIKQYADLLESAKLVSFESASRIPFVHKHADDTTGVVLSFTLIIPDTTNVCQP